MSLNKSRYRVLKSIATFTRKRKGLLVGCLATVLGCSVYTKDMGHLAWAHLNSVTQQKKDFPSVPEYINLPSGIGYDYVVDDYPEENMTSWFRRQKHGEKFMHWKLLKLAKSKSRPVRLFALKALVELPGMSDSELREIAQASDFDTSVGLARIPGTDPRFFLPPPPVPEDMSIDLIDNELRRLLNILPIHDSDPCLTFFTYTALKTGFNEDTFSESWYRGDQPELVGAEEPVNIKIPRQEASVLLCLQALLRHSAHQDSHFLLLYNGLLPVLQRVKNQWSQNFQFHCIITQILGNLALNSEMHKHIFSSGWVGILASWFSSGESQQRSLTAAWALANMDQDNAIEETYLDGVYVLHPLQRLRENNLEADIIFVHGLLGGAFKTWRQHDSKRAQPGDTSSDYSTCWPKDWLAVDFPKCRILAVDYDSQLSNWRTKCPYDEHSRTLAARSTHLLEKLLSAGFGERPIIWVTHSMGGLLVKQLLLQAWDSQEEDKNRIVTSTRGLVFYSVPHRGSHLANLKPSLQYLFLPSAEVQELKDSPLIRRQHEKLVALLKDMEIKCLSFGETLRTSLGFRWTLLIVPEESADPGIGSFHPFPVNHLGSCKPEDRHSPLYSLLVEFISSCLYSKEEAQMLFSQGLKMRPLEMALMTEFS